MSRSRALQFYIWLIGLSALSVIVACLVTDARQFHADVRSLVAAGLFVVLGVVSSWHSVITGKSSSHHMGTVAHVACIILFPFPIAIPIIGLSKLISEGWLVIKRERRPRGLVVNTGGTVLSTSAGSLAFHALGGTTYLWANAHQPQALLAVPALATLGLLYYAGEAAIVVGAITLSQPGEDISAIIRRIVLSTVRGELSLTFVGIVFAILCYFSPVLCFFVVVPVMWSFRALESVVQLRKETVDSVLKMAEIIERRDTGTFDHSKRMADQTRRLATALKLIPETVDDIVLASKVHDLGKIGISNSVLLKAGPLTPEERDIMQEHPKHGSEILSSYSAIKDSVQLMVKHHHERWDGRGYPEGLEREAIPIGSRIIAVVDSYDAMTADRPYRSGMPPQVAVGRLKDGMGSQFDPQVCAKFIDLLIEDGIYHPPESQPELHLVQTEMTAS